MNKKPIITIGIPVFNGEKYLENALESIRKQTFNDFEAIIFDNASTDRTAEICKKYVELDPRFKYHRNENNLGAARNFNLLVDQAVGKYFKWAAHDDLLRPTYLQECIEVLEKHPDVVLCYPKTVLIDGDDQFISAYDDNMNLQSDHPHERYQQFHQLYYPGLSTLCNPVFGLFRLDILRQTPLINNYTSSDMVLLGEVALRGKIYEVNEELFLSRIHPESSTRAYPDYRSRDEWFDPSKKGKIQFPHWRWAWEYLIAILKVKMGLKEKWLCLIELGKWFKINWRVALRPELKVGGIELIKRSDFLVRLIRLVRRRKTNA